MGRYTRDSFLPRWLVKAKGYLGLEEYKGNKHNPKIIEWWIKIRAHFTDDETPWCAGFVGGVLEECGIKSSRSASARSYLKWGRKPDKIAIGAVVVFWRKSINSPYGHVGFFVGVDRSGNILVLGGNQGNKVSIVPISKNRLLDYRWPEEELISNGCIYSNFSTKEDLSADEQ